MMHDAETLALVKSALAKPAPSKSLFMREFLLLENGINLFLETLFALRQVPSILL
jgi:hypothetical protein